jgi:hypothetical protein
MTENSEILDERKMIFSSFSEIFKGMKRIDDVFIAIKRSGARYTGIVAGGLLGLPSFLQNHIILSLEPQLFQYQY